MAARRSTHGTRNASKRVRQEQAVAARDLRVMADDEIPDDLEAPIAYADALRYLRRQKLICRGPLVAGKLGIEGARAALTKAVQRGDMKAIDRISREHRGVLNPSTKTLDPCGFDYVDLIESSKHPLDGSELAYRCPKCGVEGVMRPARFNVIDPPKARR
jgi:hypothetical protein